MYWQREAIQEKKADINGIYTIARTFYGTVSTENSSLEVITKENRLIDIRKIDLGKLAPMLFIMYPPLNLKTA